MSKPIIQPLAAKAKAALAAVERLTATVESMTRMCRENWQAYGQALLDQRRLMPDKRAFGRWVRENKLDTGLAKRPEVRSNAMWLAEHWSNLQSCKFPALLSHPTEIRRQYLALAKRALADERQYGGTVTTPDAVWMAVEEIERAAYAQTRATDSMIYERHVTPELHAELVAAIDRARAAADVLGAHIGFDGSPGMEARFKECWGLRCPDDDDEPEHAPAEANPVPVQEAETVH